MKKKLTLSIEEKVLELAKKECKQTQGKGQVPFIISRFLEEQLSKRYGVKIDKSVKLVYEKSDGKNKKLNVKR